MPCKGTVVQQASPEGWPSGSVQPRAEQFGADPVPISGAVFGARSRGSKIISTLYPEMVQRICHECGVSCIASAHRLIMDGTETRRDP
jgi:hypothetical protein